MAPYSSRSLLSSLPSLEPGLPPEMKIGKNVVVSSLSSASDVGVVVSTSEVGVISTSVGGGVVDSITVGGSGVGVVGCSVVCVVCGSVGGVVSISVVGVVGGSGAGVLGCVVGACGSIYT